MRTSEKFLTYVPVKRMSVFSHIPQIASLCGRCKKRRGWGEKAKGKRERERPFPPLSPLFSLSPLTLSTPSTYSYQTLATHTHIITGVPAA